MPEAIADPPAPSCNHLLFGTEIQESQLLAPDPFSSRARDAHVRDRSGRFARGHSGNPRGRPAGIRNPKRRVLDLQGWWANRQAALALLDRKPWLWRPLLAQVLPPRRAIDPAERLGIRLASLRTPEDVQRVVRKIWAALSRGEIAPAEAARLSRRVLRAVQRREQLERQRARPVAPTQPSPASGGGSLRRSRGRVGTVNKTDPVRPPLG